jgi:dCTP deaminase
VILKSDRIAELLANAAGTSDPLAICPQPPLSELRSSGSGAVDLRLGTWFVTLRQSRIPYLDVTRPGCDGGVPGENRIVRTYHIPFGESFILHPRYFVLGVTMEWIRIPRNIGGYVVGKSSWGRRGLVIATAIGVHPGFSGCLTLEITNLGELPIAIKPGMRICQLFLHHVDTSSEEIDKSSFVGKRRPTLGKVEIDPTAAKLSESPA